MEKKTNAELLGDTVMIVPAAVYTDYVERAARAETLIDALNEKISDMTVRRWQIEKERDAALAELEEAKAKIEALEGVTEDE
jgi:hypothetical protein